MKSRLIRDRSNENPGLLGANPARSSGPQNDTERTGDLAPQSLGGAACGEVVAQQNEVAMFTPQRKSGELTRIQVRSHSLFVEGFQRLRIWVRLTQAAGCAVCPTRSMARHLGVYDGRNENFREPRKER